MMLSHRESQAPLIVRPCVRISRPLPVLLSAAHPALAPFQHVAMSDEHLTPTVKWAQRKDALFLTIDIPDAKDTDIKLTETSLSFVCVVPWRLRVVVVVTACAVTVMPNDGWWLYRW